MIDSSFPRPKDKQMTKIFEGFRENAYRCTAGHLTIGYGFNLDNPAVVALGIGRTISQEAADRYFEILYMDAVIGAGHYVGSDVWDKLKDDHRAILTDMIYNLGASKLNTFIKLKAAWQAGDLAGVRREMTNSKWFSQTGRRARALVDMV